MRVSDEAAASLVPIAPDQVEYLIALAARAPPIHKTQPWRFPARQYSIDAFARPSRNRPPPPPPPDRLLSPHARHAAQEGSRPARPRGREGLAPRPGLASARRRASGALHRTGGAPPRRPAAA